MTIPARSTQPSFTRATITRRFLFILLIGVAVGVPAARAKAMETIANTDFTWTSNCTLSDWYVYTDGIEYFLKADNGAVVTVGGAGALNGRIFAAGEGDGILTLSTDNSGSFRLIGDDVTPFDFGALGIGPKKGTLNVKGGVQVTMENSLAIRGDATIVNTLNVCNGTVELARGFQFKHPADSSGTLRAVVRSKGAVIVPCSMSSTRDFTAKYGDYCTIRADSGLTLHFAHGNPKAGCTKITAEPEPAADSLFTHPTPD